MLTVSRVQKMTVVKILVELFLWVLFSTLIHCSLLEHTSETWSDCMQDPNKWLMGLFWAIAIIIINEAIRFVMKRF